MAMGVAGPTLIMFIIDTVNVFGHVMRANSLEKEMMLACGKEEGREVV